MNRLRFGKSLWISALAATGIAALLPTEANAAGPFQFYAITPCRAIDTRDVGQPWSGALAAGAIRSFTIKGAAPCSIPTDVAAVAINVTVTLAGPAGFLTVFPGDQVSPPLVSTINFATGELGLANGAIVPLSVATPDLKVVYGNGTGTGTVDVIIDINGYFK